MKTAQPAHTLVGVKNIPAVTQAAGCSFADSIDLALYDRIDGLRDEWLEAEKTSSISVYQRFGWVRQYLKAEKLSAQLQPLIVIGRLNGEIVFILPFAIQGKIIKKMQFVGGSHVNFNLGIFPKKYADKITPETINTIFKRILKVTPGLGYAKLCCQPESWLGVTNPLLNLPKQASANPAFLLDLKDSFEETLAQGNAKRKRKKFRSQERAAEKLGGYELVKASDAITSKQILRAFFEQKSYRLKSLGIKDVFSNDTVQSFLENLAKRSDESQPLLELYALKIGDDIAAVFGGGVLNGRMSGYFSSIDIAKYAALSPGEMLLYLVVKDCCEQGFTQIDLGAGEERYKQSWCSHSISLYDVIVPLGILSYPIVSAQKLYGVIRRSVRENEKTWGFYKKIRKTKAIFQK